MKLSNEPPVRVRILVTEGAAPGVKAVHPDPLVLVLVLVAEVAALEIEAVHLVLLVYLELDCEGEERLERLVDGE